MCCLCICDRRLIDRRGNHYKWQLYIILMKVHLTVSRLAISTNHWCGLISENIFGKFDKGKERGKRFSFKSSRQAFKKTWWIFHIVTLTFARWLTRGRLPWLHCSLLTRHEIFKDSVLAQVSGKYPMTANLEFQQKSLGKHKTDHSYINVHYKRIFWALFVSYKEPESTQFVLDKYIFAFIIDSIKYHRKA